MLAAVNSEEELVLDEFKQKKNFLLNKRPILSESLEILSEKEIIGSNF